MCNYLTKKQVNLLNKTDDEVQNIYELPQPIYNKLEKINDYDNLWADVNRFLVDRAFIKKYNIGGTI